MKKLFLALTITTGLFALPNRGQAQFDPGDGAVVASAILYGPPILATHILTVVNLGQVLGSRTFFDEAGAIGELVFSTVGLVGLMTPFFGFDAANGMPAWMWAITISTAMSFTWNITHAILSLAMPRAPPLPMRIGFGPSGVQLFGRF